MRESQQTQQKTHSKLLGIRISKTQKSYNMFNEVKIGNIKQETSKNDKFD